MCIPPQHISHRKIENKSNLLWLIYNFGEFYFPYVSRVLWVVCNVAIMFFWRRKSQWIDGKFCAWVDGAQCSQGAAVRRIKLMSQELFVSLLQGGFLLRTSAPGPSKTRISFSNHPYVAPPAAAASEAALLFPYTCSSIAKRDSKVRLRHASHQSITSLSPNYVLLPSHYSYSPAPGDEWSPIL